MGLPHPLCNKFPLQAGAQAVAILNMVGSSVLILIGLVLVFFNFESNDVVVDEEEPTIKVNTVMTIMGVCFIFAGIVSVLIAVLLYKGVETKNVKKCQIWMIIAMLENIWMVINVLTGTGTFTSLGTFIFQSYCMWIVWEFIKETKREQESGGGCISGP